MVNTPDGHCGRRRREDRHAPTLTLDIVSAAARGGYFARRAREIYLSGGAGTRRGTR